MSHIAMVVVGWYGSSMEENQHLERTSSSAWLASKLATTSSHLYLRALKLYSILGPES